MSSRFIVTRQAIRVILVDVDPAPPKSARLSGSGEPSQASRSAIRQRQFAAGLRCSPTEGKSAECQSLVSGLEEARPSRPARGGPSRKAATPERKTVTKGGVGSAKGRPVPRLHGGFVDSAARRHRDRANDRGAVSSGSRVEDSGNDEVVLAETGAAGQGEERGTGGILENRAVAGDKKNAAQQRAWIFFEDESGFSQQPSIRRTWAPRGKTPILKARGNHWSRTSVAAAVGFHWNRSRSRLLGRTKADSHNSESLMVFLQELKRFVRGQRVILVWDHLPAHRSCSVSTWPATGKPLAKASVCLLVSRGPFILSKVSLYYARVNR